MELPRCRNQFHAAQQPGRTGLTRKGNSRPWSFLLLRRLSWPRQHPSPSADHRAPSTLRTPSRANGGVAKQVLGCIAAKIKQAGKVFYCFQAHAARRVTHRACAKTQMRRARTVNTATRSECSFVRRIFSLAMRAVAIIVHRQWRAVNCASSNVVAP